MKKLLVAILTAGLATWAGAGNENEAENLIDWGNPAEWTGKVQLNKEFKHSGEFSFETYGDYPTRTDFREFIPIDPESTYTLSAYMRSLDPAKPASAYLGLYMFDQDKRLIAIKNVAVFPETESVLVNDAVESAQEIIVRYNPNYSDYENAAVAFNIEDDYGDLPNYDISPRVKAFSPEENGSLKITLTAPLKKSYPAGSKVRLHSPWGAPFYWGVQGWMPGEWEKFSIFLKGIADSGTPKDKFWKGTKYVKPFIWFGNWDRRPEDGARLLVDDISFIKTR